MDQSWEKVEGPEQVDALQQLASNRHLLGSIQRKHAESLQRVLSAPHASTPAVTHALQLLSRFAQRLHLSADESPGGAAAAADEPLLLQVVATALHLLEDTQSPPLAAAGVLFLGTAVRALPAGAAAENDAVVHSLSRLLTEHGPSIAADWRLVEEAAAGVGHALCAVQVSDTAAQWLLSILLEAWVSQAAEIAVSLTAQPGGLDHLMPLWRMMQTVGHAVPQQAMPPLLPPQSSTAAAAQRQQQQQDPGGAVGERLHGYASTLCSVIQDDRTAANSAAALLAAAGFMQGLRAANTGGITLSVIVHMAAWLPPACVTALEALRAADHNESSVADAQLAALRRDAAALASLVASQGGHGEGQAPCSAAELRCQAGALLEGVTDLRGVCVAAHAGQPPETAARGTQARGSGVLAQHTSPLSGRVLQAYQQASCDSQASVQQATLRAAARFAEAWDSCAACAPPGWLQRASDLGVRQALEQAFSTFVPLLFAMWARARGTVEAGAAAALVLDTLAFLHFARARHGLYADLVQATLGEVAASSEASRRLAAGMPAYATLTAPPPGQPGAAVQPAWLAQPALGARVQFLCSVLAPCAQQLSQGPLQRLMPEALLHVQHPAPATVAAAHSLFGALLQALPEADREPWAAAYARRALPAFPAVVSAQQLSAALDAAAKLLPVGSLVPVLIAQYLSRRCQKLLADAVRHPGFEAHLAASAAGGDAAAAAAGSAVPSGAEAALQLAQLLAHLLLVVDFHVLHDIMDAAEAATAAAHPALRHQVCGAMYDVLASSDDYIRKVELMRWHQRMLYNVMLPPKAAAVAAVG